jgi:AraC family transcriptional regulator
MDEYKGRFLDTHRIIRPDEVEIVVPEAKVVAEGVAGRGPLRRVTYRDYQSSEPGQSLVPGIDGVVLIIYRDAETQLRRRIEGSWKVEHIPLGNVAIIGGGRPTELEWQGQTRISHVCLSHEVMAQTAAALEQDYEKLEIIDPLHFKNPQLLAVGDMLIQELRALAGSTTLLIDLLTSSLGVYLLRHGHRNSAQLRTRGGTPQLTTVQRALVLDFIEANIARNFRLQELATVAGLSEVHFARCFTNTFRESPHQFVLKQRILLAIERICRTKLNFAEIAELSGFADQAHLTRAVKKATGHTPSELRKA